MAEAAFRADVYGYFLDALWVKIREERLVRTKAMYLELGVLPDGTRDILESGSKIRRPLNAE
jgi:transposase-like protein